MVAGKLKQLLSALVRFLSKLANFRKLLPTLQAMQVAALYHCSWWWLVSLLLDWMAHPMPKFLGLFLSRIHCLSVLGFFRTAGAGSPSCLWASCLAGEEEIVAVIAPNIGKMRAWGMVGVNSPPTALGRKTHGHETQVSALAVFSYPAVYLRVPVVLRISFSCICILGLGALSNHWVN